MNLFLRDEVLNIQNFISLFFLSLTKNVYRVIYLIDNQFFCIFLIASSDGFFIFDNQYLNYSFPLFARVFENNLSPHFYIPINGLCF